MEVDYKNLDGWAIPREAFDWIRENIPSGSTILELGSGTGTKELVKFYKVYTVEEHEKWMNIVPQANYIYAPITPFENMQPHTLGWYDRQALTNLPASYDAIIIDGPMLNNRVNIIHFSHLFKNNIPYIIDDTQRAGDREMAIRLANKLDREYFEIKGWQKKTIIFTV